MFKNIYTTRMSDDGKMLKRRFEKISSNIVKFKKTVSTVCIFLLLFTVVFSTMVMAQFDRDNYIIEITNNGKTIELNNKPFIKDGEVYVPLEELFSKLELMEGDFAKIEYDSGVTLITLGQKNQKEGVVSEYTSYLYKIEIGKNELIINPKELMHINTPEEITNVIEKMNNAPIIKDKINECLYVPFSYAERMAERADRGLLSPPDLYKLEVKYSGETLRIEYPVSVYYKITQGFGKRVHPITGEEKYHNGIDFSADAGTEVYAGIDGKFKVDYNEEKGAYVTIFGKNGVEITYCHLDSKVLSTFWREMVTRKGDVIGYVGSTGMSTGPHLHMEVKINGEYVNPELYLITD